MGISRPLKFMQIYENKYRWTEHGCIGFRYTRDPEYSDSELRAVEASGESRDEQVCPSTPLNSTPADRAETLSQAD